MWRGWNPEVSCEVAAFLRCAGSYKVACCTKVPEYIIWTNMVSEDKSDVGPHQTGIAVTMHGAENSMRLGTKQCALAEPTRSIPRS